MPHARSMPHARHSTNRVATRALEKEKSCPKTGIAGALDLRTRVVSYK